MAEAGVKEVIGGRKLSFERGVTPPQQDFEHTIHWSFPTLLAPPTDSMNSPFLQAVLRIGGEAVMERAKRRNILNKFVAEHVSDIERLVRNYRSGNFELFDAECQEWIHDRFAVRDRHTRIRALNQIFGLITVSIIADSDRHQRIISEISERLVAIENSNSNGYATLINEIEQNTWIDRTFNDIFTLMPRFLRMRQDFYQVLVDFDPEDPTADFPDGLLITRVGGFDTTLQLYVDCYEGICRSLTALSGLLNLEQRGDCDVYPNPPKQFKTFHPQSMERFDVAPNAPKLAFITTDPSFADLFGVALNPSLRNAIGHFAWNYDPNSGIVTFNESLKNNTTVIKLSYGAILIRLIRLMILAYQISSFYSMLLEDGIRSGNIAAS